MNRTFLLFLICVGVVVFFVQSGKYDELKNINTPNQNTQNLEISFINNPNLLIGLDQGAYAMNEDFKRNPLCTERKYIIIPKDAQYNPKLNKITARYRMPMQHMFILNGVNARDFGYQYIYAGQTKNIDFKSENNITKNAYRLKDYIHTGGSCGISGGCNNGSQNQPYLDFTTRDDAVGTLS